MNRKKQEHSKPPQPPPISRKFEIRLYQMIGLPLIMLVPILALLGIFGETVDSTVISSPQLEMRVEYPTRFRYKMLDSITVTLRNVSGQPISALDVRFARAYIRGFSTVTFTPPVKSITEEDYILELNDLQPEETRIITVSIQAEKYGTHKGTIRVTPESAESVQVSLGTFIFP